MKLWSLFFLFLTFFYSAGASGAGPPHLEGVLLQSNSVPPDVSSWKVEAIYRIDVRLSDLVVVYLGFEVLYSNPNNVGEFALVTKRHRPLIMAKSDPRNDRKFQKAIIANYNRKEIEDKLKRRFDEADIIVVQVWHAVKNRQTGQFDLIGDVEIWFLDADGTWSEKMINQKVSIEPVSHLRSADFKDGIIAGIKYSIGNKYQIIRAEQVFLVMVLREDKK